MTKFLFHCQFCNELIGTGQDDTLTLKFEYRIEIDLKHNKIRCPHCKKLTKFEGHVVIEKTDCTPQDIVVACA